MGAVSNPIIPNGQGARHPKPSSHLFPLLHLSLHRSKNQSHFPGFGTVIGRELRIHLQ